MQAVVQLNAPPNTPVFTLQARDPDSDHNIHYFIVRDRSEFSAFVLTLNWFYFNEVLGMFFFITKLISFLRNFIIYLLFYVRKD